MKKTQFGFWPRLLLGSAGVLMAAGFLLRWLAMGESFGRVCLDMLLPLALGAWVYDRQRRHGDLEKLAAKVFGSRTLAMGLPWLPAGAAVLLDQAGVSLSLYLSVAAYASYCVTVQYYGCYDDDRALLGNLGICVGYLFLTAWLGGDLFTMLVVGHGGIMTGLLYMIERLFFGGNKGKGLFLLALYAVAAAVCYRLPYLEQQSIEGLYEVWDSSGFFGGDMADVALLYVRSRFGWIPAAALMAAAGVLVFSALKLYDHAGYLLQYPAFAAHNLLVIFVIADVLRGFEVPYVLPGGALFTGGFFENLVMVLAVVLLSLPGTRLEFDGEPWEEEQNDGE